MIKYLKKKKIHKLAECLGYPVPALKDCTYKSGRGSEWFSWITYKNDDDYITTSIYVSPSYMSIEEEHGYYDECDGDMSELLNRRVVKDKEYIDLLNSVND